MENSTETLVWYLGKQIPLNIYIDSNIDKSIMFFDDTASRLIIHIPNASDVSNTMKRFYSRETKRIVEALIREYQSQFPSVKSVSIKDSYAFWGQCNAKKQLVFHWQLSMVPQDAIAYVVIHELCHLLHLNHDRSFWRLVGKYCPDYVSMQQKLAWYQTVIQK